MNCRNDYFRIQSRNWPANSLAEAAYQDRLIYKERVYSCSFLAILFFLFHVLLELLLTIRYAIDYILDISIGIYLFLVHILLLMCSRHLLLLHHLLMLDRSSVLLVCHLILLLIVFGCILDDVGVFANTHWYVTRCVWLPFSWRWDVLAFVSVVEFSSLHRRKSLKWPAENHNWYCRCFPRKFGWRDD